MKKMVWFDMDNTLADLHSVPSWVKKLRAYDPTPYAKAAVMHNMSILARYLNKVQAAGYGIGIISWLSKYPTPEYDKAVIATKMEWLNQHLHSVNWDSIQIVAYGTPKQLFMKTENDILFDDEKKNRNDWLGEAYEPNQIMEILKSLLAR